MGLMVVTFENESLPPLELIVDTGTRGSLPWLFSASGARRRGFDHSLMGVWFSEEEAARGFAAGPLVIGHRGVRLYEERSAGERQPYTMGGVADGLVGLRAFSNEWLIELDFEQRVIGLHNRRGFTHPRGGAEIPLSYDFGIPVLEARCEASCGRSPVELLVDTGFVGDVLLFRESAAPAPHERGVPVIDFGRHKDCRAYRGRLTLGSFQLDEVLFAVCPKRPEDRTAGYLGVGVLSRFRVILDTERDRMILEPSKNLHRRTEWDMLGVWWRSRTPPLPRRVRWARPGFAAAKAGLLAGDIVLSINGRDTSELPEWELMDAARGAWGMTLTFRIRRGEKEQDLPVKLKPMI